MRRNILVNQLGLFQIIILILFSLFVESKAQDVLIRSLKCYSSKSEISFPVINSKDPEKSTITIEFDIQNNYLPNLNIWFRFCDSNWQPYESAFFLNPTYNTEYNLYFDRLPSTVTGARYHYKDTFPNKNVNFPFSGKWMYYIVDSQNNNIIYASGKFYVVNPGINIGVGIYKERLDGKIPDQASLGRTIAIKSNFLLPDSLFPSQLEYVEIIENEKLDSPIIINRNLNNASRYYEWNGSNEFSFIARQLLPGNEYRQTDFRSYDKFHQETINAQYIGVETSDFFQMNKPDFNGGSILTNYMDKYADYLNVNFKLRPPENITSPIFLVGAFTKWKVLPDYEMFDDNGLMNISIQLKRGAYDYQYVTGDYVNGEIKNIDWHILEGNFWETKNEYNIFVFYKTNDLGGYDQIIGYKKIISGVRWEN